MTATMIDSRYSRPTDFLKAVGEGVAGFSFIGGILPIRVREPEGPRGTPPGAGRARVRSC